jgi:hypothetical protein
LQLAIAVGDLLEWEQRFAPQSQVLPPRPELAGHATVLVIAPSDYNQGCDTCEPAWKYFNKLDVAYARHGIRGVQVTNDPPPPAPPMRSRATTASPIHFMSSARRCCWSITTGASARVSGT